MVVPTMMVVILMMTVGGGDDSDGESSDGADGHKNDRDDDDGCLDSVKNFFKNKQINVENFSISTWCRKSLYC